MLIIRTGKRYCKLIASSKGLRAQVRSLQAAVLHTLVHFAWFSSRSIVGQINVRDCTFEMDFGRRELATVLEVLLENSYIPEEGWAAKNGDTVLDIGANIGVYSVLQARRAPSQGLRFRAVADHILSPGQKLIFEPPLQRRGKPLRS